MRLRFSRLRRSLQASRLRSIGPHLWIQLCELSFIFQTYTLVGSIMN